MFVYNLKSGKMLACYDRDPFILLLLKEERGFQLNVL